MEKIKKFKGKSKMLDNNKVVYGYGCYTDKSRRQFILVDDDINTMRPIQVEKIENN